MADNKKILKGVGITAGILAGIWVAGSLITGKWNPLKWFSPSASDCKTPDGKDGKLDSAGNCVALPATRRDAPKGWCKGADGRWVTCAQ